MIVCGIEGFFQDTVDQSLCKLPHNHACTNRYNNLANNGEQWRKTRSSDRTPINRTDPTQIQNEIIFRRQKLSSSVGISADYVTVLFLAIFISINKV